MNKAIKLILLIVAIAVGGCYKDGVKKVSTDNNSFDVTLLFTVDSCSVYRFYDGGNAHYFVNREGKTMSRHGSKGQVIDDIQTIE